MKNVETVEVESDVLEVEEKVAVDLEPYKIKNINNFYQRDHPTQLNPFTPKYKKYWYDFAVKSVEGAWINDEGTWYWMPPKSFFYVNYLTIEDKKRDPIHATYRDIDRIIGRYITCADGFSGFEDDEEYTCNIYVEKKLDGTLIPEDEHLISKHCYKPGTDELKTYINAWEYLQHHYLIDKPAKRPLGRSLWENPIKNQALFSSRFTGKSVTYFVGDFMHEWFFCGVNRREDLDKTQRKYLFAMGSMDSANLIRSTSLIESAMTRLPGRYRFPRIDGNKIADYSGPFYKNYNSSFKPGNTVMHIEKDGSGNVTKSASMASIRIITPDKTKIVAGDRFRRIYIEEAGFLEQLLEVHANSKDSLRLGSERVGSIVYLGTSGDIKAFRPANEIFTNPDTYDVYGVPNHWKGGKKIGLFIPTYYVDRRFCDENENTNIDRALKFVLEDRARRRKTESSASYDKSVMYHPIEPSEMMRPSGNSVLPKQEAQAALNHIEAHDIFKKRAAVGWLEYDKTFKTGVKFALDVANVRAPILDFNTQHLRNTEGAFIQYETPPIDPPDNLYHVIYDPAAQSGEGTSFHSVLVYKYIFTGPERTLKNTIVAEWLGRLGTLEQNWAMVIKIAKYFNAKIFPEYNTPGFIDWCKSGKLFHMLRRENVSLRREINPKAGSSHWVKGFRMDKRTKGWCLNRAADWLLEPLEYDELGIPTKRVIDTIYSPRLLQEIIYFDPDTGNYDHISSMLGLQILMNDLDRGGIPIVKDEFSRDEYYYTQAEEVEYVAPYTRRARSKICDF